ncbi:hydroxylysine kinase [Drosophila grimshawi]|uniref:Hydroxylysine kinase n=1 Tax=Drosophila grimshawi TaxID=7222 RepID=B4JBY5_DROGR|nr:hydroxylysine kinase [Drosophila grimshawi]XP_032591636.1 hydroxylysine kinase [Drosophila grimshawi]XP_032591637.1 hydroxylysine kinase [Drosophila grimshawi]EDW04088.1 GH11604 [Drosophila grimshawi]
MEQWNNVELTSITKKSYTLNHVYDGAQKLNSGKANETTTTTPTTSTTTTTTSATNGKESAPAEGDGVLQPGSDIKPKIEPENVEPLVRRLYGITVSELKELNAYDDRNYWIQADCNVKNPLIVSHCPHGYVLKILNALDSKKEDFVDAQNQLLLYLAKQNVQCPRPIANARGSYYSVEQLSGNGHVVRLLEYIPGKMFHEVDVTKNLLYQSGEYLAKLDRALKSFTHKAYETHKTLWMLQSVPQLRDFLYVLEDHQRKALCEEIIDTFESKVLRLINLLELQIIHGDYNEQNILVNATNPDRPNSYRVTGVIDFGDTSRSPLIFELGIAMTYMMLQAKDLASGGIFLAGYTSVQSVNDVERGYLKYCVAARLAQSLIMGAYTHTLHPGNDYVLVTQAQGWTMLEQLWRDQLNTIDELWDTTAHQYLTQSTK